MKFIEKLFGKKEPETVDIRFDDLAAWLALYKGKISVTGHAESMFSEITDALSGIKESASDLQKAEPEGRFHLKMVKIATSNRDNMVKQVSLLIDNINIPKKTDVKTVLEFHENSMQTLNMCLENMMKSYHYTKMVFFDESKKVIAEVNELGRLLNRLVEPVNDNKSVLDAFESGQVAIQNIKEMNSQIEAENRRIKEINEKIDTFKKKIELNQKSLAHLAESEQWKHYTNCKNDLADLEDKATKALSDIDVILVPLKKPLLRLKQLNEDGKFDLAPGIKKEILSCLSDPKSVSMEFFDEFSNILARDTVAFNPEKRNMFLEQIKYVGTKFGTIQKEYQTIISSVNAKKAEISGMNIVQEAANLTGRITTLRENIASFEKEIDSSKKHLSSLEESSSLKKQELQRIISTIDRRKKVLFQ